HLVQEKRVSRSTHGVYVAAVHFLYRVTLDRPWVVRRIPFPRRERERLPEVLSQAEIERLLRAVSRLKHRAMQMVAYGAGLRVGGAPRGAAPAGQSAHAPALLCDPSARSGDRHPRDPGVARPSLTAHDRPLRAGLSGARRHGAEPARRAAERAVGTARVGPSWR